MSKPRKRPPGIRNCYFIGPMLEGRYGDAYLKAAGKDAPKFTDDETEDHRVAAGFRRH